MSEIETLRKRLNQQQTDLRRIMLGFDQHEKAIALCLDQHAMLHSAKMSNTGVWSFEDAMLDDMSHEHIQRIPKHSEHSVAWLFWHMTRIEDVAMNFLVADSPQILGTELGIYV